MSWEKLPNCKLGQGDCLELMRGIPDGSVDMVLIDPPYRMTKKGKSCRPNYMPTDMGDNFFGGALPNTADWMREIFRVLDCGHIYIFTNTNQLHENLNTALSTGFRLHNVISMIKDTKMPNRWYLKYTELVLMFRKGKAIPINNKKSRDYQNVIMPTQRSGKVHPTQKPQSLIDSFVANSSHTKQVVLDCFMGSGTTGVACVNLNRRFIGIEKDATYFALAKDRIHKAIEAKESVSE